MITRTALSEGWIAIADRLPAEGMEILALVNGEVRASRFQKGSWISFQSDSMKGVTHWMPLPTAPDVSSLRMRQNISDLISDIAQEEGREFTLDDLGELIERVRVELAGSRLKR